MTQREPEKLGQPSEPGEYDDGMQALLQIIWGEGFLSPGGAAEIERLLEGSDIAGLRGAGTWAAALGPSMSCWFSRYKAASVVGHRRRSRAADDHAAHASSGGPADRSHSGPCRSRAVHFPLPTRGIRCGLLEGLAGADTRQAGHLCPKFCGFCAPGRPLHSPATWLRGGSPQYSPEMLEFFRLEGIAYNMATLEESAAGPAAGRLRSGSRSGTAMTGIWISPSGNFRPWKGA